MTPTTVVIAASVAAPVLLAFNPPPSPTVLNQCLATGLWGASACLVGLRRRAAARVVVADLAPLLAAGGLLAAGVVVSATPGVLPWTIANANLAVLGCAVVAAWCGRSGDPEAMSAGLMIGLAAAALISALIAVIQVFAPGLADGDLIARPATAGRGVGNLRQPNHLASLLLWGAIAVATLGDAGRMARAATIAGFALLLLGVALSGSRTGMLGVVVLCAWGCTDRRLQPSTRSLLGLSPVVFAIAWIGVAAWAHLTGQPFAAEGRIAPAAGGDISSSRFAIWSNALQLLRHEPWTGVGFGEFNLAWTLSALPDRPVAFFDHTHNLPLQLLVELGLPLGLVVCGLLGWALHAAWRRTAACSGPPAAGARGAFMVVLMIGLHSLLEYPLWYAYFLLPCVFAWGIALRAPAAVDATPPATTSMSRVLPGLGLVMIVGTAGAVLDYRRIAAIYDPPDNAAPLEERVRSGQRSPLFGHHADYAAATAFGPPQAPLPAWQTLAFQRATHQLLDIRLMIAWSQALAAEGAVDRARWLAARVREFRNPAADEYFEPCTDAAEAALAFQCQPPQHRYDWRAFVAR